MLGVGRNLVAWVMIGAIVGVLASTAVAAKECECKEHKAGANGQGTCTLTETSTRCSINYTGSASQSAASRGFTQSKMVELQKIGMGRSSISEALSDFSTKSVVMRT